MLSIRRWRTSSVLLRLFLILQVKTNLSRNSLVFIALLAILALGISSCSAPEESELATTSTTDNNSSGSSDTTDETSSTLKGQKIVGFVQKGPFFQGTEIAVREMDKTLTPTGRTFTGTIEDNTGRFQAKGNLAHAIVELSADGYYFNEVSGSLTSGKLTLQAMSDLTESSSVNVNLMTHLERKRVEDILESRYPYVSAKSIAQNDILKIFNIEDVKIGNSKSPHPLKIAAVPRRMISDRR